MRARGFLGVGLPVVSGDYSGERLRKKRGKEGSGDQKDNRWGFWLKDDLKITLG